MESIYLNQPGMGNTFKWNAKKPCEKDCAILNLDTTLEYADGTAAENANGVNHTVHDA
jgi:hypothetical protein